MSYSIFYILNLFFIYFIWFLYFIFLFLYFISHNFWKYISVNFWYHRNRTGTIYIHEPNRTGGKSNHLDANRKPVTNRLRTAGICLFFIHFSTGFFAWIRRIIFLIIFICAKINLIDKKKNWKTERGEKWEKITV
jgi:hypothetical protein